MSVTSTTVLDASSATKNIAVRDLSAGGVLYPMIDPEVSTNHLVTAATTNATIVLAAPGVLRAVRVHNHTTYPIFVKFHNTASTPTAGSGVVYVVAVQAGVSNPDPRLSGGGRAFSSGIGMTVVKDIADAGTTAVAASDAVIEVEYHAA